MIPVLDRDMSGKSRDMKIIFDIDCKRIEDRITHCMTTLQMLLKNGETLRSFRFNFLKPVLKFGSQRESRRIEGWQREDLMHTSQN